MFKKVIGKVVVGGFLLAMVAAIVVGVVSLVAPSEEAHAQSGARRGAGRGEQAALEQQGQAGQGQGQGQRRGRSGDEAAPGGGNGQGGNGKADGDETCTDESAPLREDSSGRDGISQGGRGQWNTGRNSTGQGGNGGQGNGQRSAEPQTEIANWQIVEGFVVETEELVVETADGQTVQVGLGPSQYRESQDFALNLGAKVRVSGYWEGDEFKAMQVEDLDSGESIVLRDVSGRPMWAGQGRRGG